MHEKLPHVFAGDGDDDHSESFILTIGHIQYAGNLQ